MGNYYFDESGRFVIEDYSALRPFASFLPGIAGPMGIPMWAFYVNRGQAIASFGVESKDRPVMEFQPANKAYQLTPFIGFRTFIKLRRESSTAFYEPFSPLHRSTVRKQSLHIAANELEVRESLPEAGLQARVLYFILPNENLAGLVRQVAIENVSSQAIEGELLDGLPVVIPYGVNNALLKEIGRTAEAWMEVFNREQGIPFFRVRSSVEDKPQVEGVEAGHFYLAFVESTQLLPAIADAELVFGQDTSLSYPDSFLQNSLAELVQRRQNTAGKTPCGFFGTALRLSPGESVTISSVIGHVRNVNVINSEFRRIARPEYVQAKRREANELVDTLTEAVATKTSAPLFDAYCRQNLLDNIMRGGWPVLLGSEQRPAVYHIYSRKHGDLERDYNAFFQAAEFYSQGNGNYRDVNQNRRCDVLLNPRIEDYDIVTFMNLIQADGYNPLVIQGSRFSVPPSRQAAVFELVEQPHDLERFFARAFTPGQLLKHVMDHDVKLKVTREEFLSRVLDLAEQSFEAAFGEGYWVDHWTYNLDLIESYLAVYPDQKDELLFGKPIYTFYDSPAIVRPRAEKYVLVNGQARQFGAVAVDEEKATLMAARAESPHLARTAHGRGEVYRTALFAKLVCLVAIKFATLDPFGMGIEMEADKPGWYDALNGLPGLFGSSMPETFELARLLDFVLEAIRSNGLSRSPTAEAVTTSFSIDLPVEVYELLTRVAGHLEMYDASQNPDRDFVYWDAVSGERETYRDRTRLGFDGRTEAIRFSELERVLNLLRKKIQIGVDRALELNGARSVPPTYLTYTVEDYEPLVDGQGHPRLDAKGRPFIKVKRFKPVVLPLFLEGLVRFLKIQSDPDAARRLYEQVKANGLFDRKLKMYKVNASLADQHHDIGRARAFPPGWLENESIWLHMEYKYLLEILRAKLYKEFFSELQSVLVPFQAPHIYGRSPLENSSFIVSSAHPDESLHGRGFVARLSGSTAEFLSIWNIMMAGERPFFMQDGQLALALRPALPGGLFDKDGTVAFRFLGCCTVVYHNPERRDIVGDSASKMTLETDDGQTVELAGGVIGAPYAARVRSGQVKTILVVFDEERR